MGQVGLDHVLGAPHKVLIIANFVISTFGFVPLAQELSKFILMESADIEIRSDKIGYQCPLKVAFELQGADGYHDIGVSLYPSALLIDKAIQSIIALGRLYCSPNLFPSFRLV